MNVLRIDNLSKNYGTVAALRDVSFAVPQGSVFGILGPNGSGKTTLLGTVLEILFPTSGEFCWFEDKSVSSSSLRRRIGTLLETPNYYPYLTGSQNLAITASIRGKGKDDIQRVLKQVGLDDREKLSFSKYSLGMKQRLALGGCLLGDPDVLVLDEPTNGLDPSGIADIRAIINDLYKGGKTIILASHLLDEVEKVCTHAAILKKGQILELGSMDEVLRADAMIDIAAPDMVGLRNALQEHSPALVVQELEGGFRISGEVKAQELNRFCFDKGITLNLLRSHKSTLESRFLELTDE